MTNNTGKIKKYKKKFQFINKNGARLHRKDFIEIPYSKGILDEEGNQVIRPLNQSELEFLENFYKEYVHGTFNTDEESKKLFKKAKKLSKEKENIKHLEEFGDHTEKVKESINLFNKKSKELGNMFYNFWDQRDINSDDYKRKYDIQNNCSKGLQLESFEDIQNNVEIEEDDSTQIEDLITESEK